MSDPQNQPKPNRPLSEISHLFLSSVRERQTGGAPRPVRKPPAPPVAPATPTEPIDDLTPEEYAHVFGEAHGAVASERPAHAPPISAIIASHLNGRQFDRVKEYARHLCASTPGRVGLIEVDASEFRVMCFDGGVQEDNDGATAVETFDPRQMSAAIDELNFDIDHWLLVLPSPRTPEARALLREVDHWVLLSTCDHDGVVAAYRTIKGLAEARRPRMSLAILDAQDESEVARVYRKLSGVCQQFLGWPLEAEPAVMDSETVAEHLVMFCRPTRDKAQLATAPQWQVVTNFVTKLKAASKITAPVEPKVEPQAGGCATGSAPSFTAPRPSPSRRIPVESNAPTMRVQPASSMRTDHPTTEVIDLPNADASESAILETILAQPGHELVETPVRPPMCDTVRLTVSRDHSLVLVAVARQGLSDLRDIGLSYRWLIENRGLVAMALPQFAIDAHAMPRVHLLIDQSDATADMLQPLLAAGNVSVRTYRTLRWGEKLGLLLEAA